MIAPHSVHDMAHSPVNQYTEVMAVHSVHQCLDTKEEAHAYNVQACECHFLAKLANGLAHLREDKARWRKKRSM